MIIELQECSGCASSVTGDRGVTFTSVLLTVAELGNLRVGEGQIPGRKSLIGSTNDSMHIVQPIEKAFRSSNGGNSNSAVIIKF